MRVFVIFIFRMGQRTLTAHPILIVHGMEEEPDGVPDAEEEVLAEGQPEDDVVEETMFTFEGFELVRGRTPAVLLYTHVEPVSDTHPRNSQTRRSHSRY